MSDIIEEFLAEFLAQDDAYETGFATLTDKEGHPYVAHLDSGTGKEEKSDKKSETENNIFKGEDSETKQEKIKENPLPEKMKKAVDDLNQRVTDKLVSFYKESKKVFNEYETIRQKVLETYKKKLSKVPLDELKNAYSEAVKIARMASTFNKKVNDFKDESRNEFLKIAQAKTRNKDRIWHFLSNIKNRSPLGAFAFSRQEYIPESIGNNPRDPRTGFDIVSVLGRELNSRKYKMATDSLEYKELTEFMNQYGLAQDSILTSYFEDIEIC